MPRPSPGASKKERRAAAKHEMEKFYAGDLHSGSPSGPIVTDPAQAKAIAMSVSGQSRRRKRRKR